jgi:hypothetical protein
MSLFGGKKTKSNTVDAIGSLKIQTQGYGNVIPIIFGKVRVPVTLFFYSNFKATPILEKSKSSGKGGKKKKTVTGYSYTAAVMLGMTANGISAVGKLWVDKKVYPSVAAVGFTVFGGTPTQNPWGYLSTYEPAKAVHLRGFSYLAANNYALSDNATLGNHSIEVSGEGCVGVEGDANPAVFLPLLMMRECGMTGEQFADVTAFSDFCTAQGLLFSLALTEQRTAAELISEILNLCTAELVTRNGLFHFITYYDVGLATGYSLSSDDFIAESSTAAIKLTRKKTIDCFNVLKVEFLNRQTDYNVEIAEEKDATSIAAIGLRPAETIKAHYVCNAQMARNLAHYLLQRDLLIRNTYEFTLSLRYIRLEPMDVITLTDVMLGLNDTPVIIKKIVIAPDYLLNITAEDYVFQAYQPVSYPPAYSVPTIQDQTATAGNINAPVIFAAPVVLTATGYEIWCAISSTSPLYGGCDIHLSIDGGVSYQQIGSHTGNARMGVLTADLLSGSEIDTAHTLAVDLTQSNGLLSSVGQVSVDMLETLCRVGNEFIAYRDVVLASVSHYAISYLRRGLYGSNQGAVTGDKFVRCDDALFKFPYSPAYRSMTIKLKFTSFNIYQEAPQDISTVPAYDFLITGTSWDSNTSQWDSGSTFWTV